MCRPTEDSNDEGDVDARYLLCPCSLTIGHLKKFIRCKFDLPSHLQVHIAAAFVYLELDE